MDQHPTGTVTFLFTDIEGSTKLAREFPERWESSRARHHQILREAIESNKGFVFQIIGDAFCAAFHKAGEALKAAVEAQQGLQSETWGECVIRVRMGIHTGEAKEQDGEYKGYLTLSLVQRLMSAGHGGQVLLSDASERSLHEGLPDNVDLRDLGKHYFKGFPDPLRVFQIMAPGLPADFPALRALNIRPTNLPIQLTSFVGREKELADVKRLLHDSHMLTLIGPGGTGKTRLAIQAGSELIEQFPDGVWLVELAPILDPAFVPRTIAQALGLRDEPQRPVIDMLCDYLRDKKILIVLDNCEHLVDACARTADKILRAAPDVRILASSREALGIGGEVTYRVPSLGIPDLDHLPPVESLSQYEAVKLFIDRATAVVQSFMVTNDNAPALAQICHRLDGIPLAIELAAAKTRVLSLEQIARRLDDRFRLLTGGSRAAFERHQTLRAAIDWSYNLLPDDEQALFRRLSVFVGGWTLEAAESVCADEFAHSDEILDLLEHLINKSLVVMEIQHGETRYSMLETLRQYANEKLIEVGEYDRLRDRHLEYFLNLAQTAEPFLRRPEQLEWLPVLDADYQNLRLALEWGLSQEKAEPSLTLCGALGWFWQIRCYWMEGINWLKKALAKTSKEASKREKVARLRALYTQAYLEWQLGDFDEVLAPAETSLALALEVGDRRDIAIARFFVGVALWLRGVDNDRALSLMEQSFVEFQALNDLFWQAQSFRWYGSLLARAGKLKFHDVILRSLELARKAGERLILADMLCEYAQELFRINRVDEAREHAEESDRVYKQIGAENTSVNSFVFADIAWSKGDYQKARTLYKEMLERFRLRGERYWTAYSWINLGLLALEENDLDGAQSYFEQALVLSQEVGWKPRIAYCLVELSNIFYRKGNLEEFKRNFTEAFSLKDYSDKSNKIYILMTILGSLYSRKPDVSAQLLGVIHNYEREYSVPFGTIDRRYSVRAEEYAREYLGIEVFESQFAKGQNLSLDEALDLTLKTVEEMSND